MSAHPTQIRLDEAVVAILDKIVALLQAAQAAQGLLEVVEDVVPGDVVRARPDPPYLQVLVVALIPTQARAMHETWEMDVGLMSTLQSEDPLDHWNSAIVQAAKARSVVLADRTLDGLAYVEDTQSGPVEGLGKPSGQRRLVRALAHLNVRFSIVEPKEA